MSAAAKPCVKVTRDGPYIVTGGVPLLRLSNAPDKESAWPIEESLPPRTSYALCRCGRTRMAPFCDYKHLRGRFDGGETAKRYEAGRQTGRANEPAAVGFVAQTASARDGPLWLRGEIEVVSADGSAYAGGALIALCRCGASRSKPFCDGSHAIADQRE